jgi:hypothetical protein
LWHCGKSRSRQESRLPYGGQVSDESLAVLTSRMSVTIVAANRRSTSTERDLRPAEAAPFLGETK